MVGDDWGQQRGLQMGRPLWDEFIEIGLDCTNPFQPEVMDVHVQLPHYRGRLAF